MEDIFSNRMLCNSCNKETRKSILRKQGFQLRMWECPSCKKTWVHPSDKEDYERFARLRNKRFSVKLRMVGNSYTVSIPREIIEFEQEMQKEVAKMERFISMFLESPKRLSLDFGGNIYNKEEGNQHNEI